MHKISCLFFTCLLLYGCTAVKKAGNKEVVLPGITVSAADDNRGIYRESAPRHWDILHTRAALSFNLKERTASGRAWIRLRPYFYPTDTLTLDAKSMTVDSVLILSGDRSLALPFSYSNDQLRIRFDRRYHARDSIELFIRYTARPYSGPTGGSKAITEDRGLYFINTNNEIPGKPVQIWTQGETESNSHWLPTIDKPNERTTVRLELTVPDSFRTLSNGVLVSSHPADGGLRKDVWEMDKPIQVYAIMMAIGNFVVVPDSSWGRVPVNYYVEPEYAPYARGMFRNTPEMVAYFSRITGVPYPWKKYSQVVVRDYVSGAMENTTASLYGEFMNQNHREQADKNYEDIVSHELFHQWFGDYVTTESWSNLTVNESFANYGEQLWRQYKYGKVSRDELAFDDLAKYLNQVAYNDEPLVRFHYQNKEDMFDRISYEKGGATLRYLHGLIGDEAFSGAMQAYLTGNALQAAEAHHWRLAVEQVTGQDWNWFFNQWYYRGGHPTLNIDYTYDDSAGIMNVHVHQTASDSGRAYQLPLKAALVAGADKEIVDWRIDRRKQTFSFPYREGRRPVFIPDYEHWLVGVIRETKSLPDWLTQLREADNYISRRRAVSSAFLATSDPVAEQLFRAALANDMDGIRLHALNLMKRLKEDHKWAGTFREEVTRLSRQDSSNRVRAAAYEVLGNWKVRELQAELIAALADSSYLVAGAALGALHELDKDTAYDLARLILEQRPRAHLESAAWSEIALRADSADIALFESQAHTFYGTRKLSFAASLNQYVQQTPGITAFDRGLSLLTRLAAQESIRSYRFYLGSLVWNMLAYLNENGDNGRGTQESRIRLAKKYRELLLEQETDPEHIRKYKAM